jgi:hypothetical protein
MTPQISLDDQTLDRLHREGEVKVEEAHGIPLVLMTVGAREALQKLVYDDSEPDADEFLPHGHEAFAEDWNAPGMEAYDDYEGQNPATT